MNCEPAFLTVLRLLVQLVGIVGSAGCVHVKDLKTYLLLLASNSGGGGCPRRLRGMLLRALPIFAGPRLPEATQSTRDALSDFAWSSSSAAAAARDGAGRSTSRARLLHRLPDMPPPPAFFCFGASSGRGRAAATRPRGARGAR